MLMMHPSLYLYVILVICLLNSVHAQEGTPCSENDKYNHYKESIGEGEERILLELLERYGNVYEEELKKLLEDLRKSSDSTNQNLKKFENANDMLNKSNSHLENEIIRLLEELDDLEKELGNIHFQEMDRKEIPIPVDVEDVKRINNSVNKWAELAGKISRETNEFTNLPHSISDEISFLEGIISNQDDPTCIERFDKKLKDTFKELSELFKFDDELLAELKKLSIDTEKEAVDLLEQAEDIRDNEKNSERTVDLAEEALKLAQKLEKLKSAYDETFPETKNALSEIQELKNQLSKLEADIDSVQQDIEADLDEFNCLQKYISDCQEGAADDETLPDCVEKVCKSKGK